jgi:hypothetical protein
MLGFLLPKRAKPCLSEVMGIKNIATAWRFFTILEASPNKDVRSNSRRLSNS